MKGGNIVLFFLPGAIKIQYSMLAIVTFCNNLTSKANTMTRTCGHQHNGTEIAPMHLASFNNPYAILANLANLANTK